MYITHHGTTGRLFAAYAMRAPRRSYDTSDTTIDAIGAKDKALGGHLILAGKSHSKFTRLMHAQLEIQAPLYWWKQFDTYRIGVEKVSESTMYDFWHGVELSQDHFENGLPEDIITLINACPPEVKNRLCPQGYLQTRWCVISYQALRSIYWERRQHKLEEWCFFCRALEQLPEGWIITCK